MAQIHHQHTSRSHIYIRIAVYTICIAIIILMIGAILVLRTKERAFEQAFISTETHTVFNDTQTLPPTQFPIGVNPQQKEITETNDIDAFIALELTANDIPERGTTAWIQKVIAKLAAMPWYQQLASPTGRILIIESGERREQVAKHFGDILDWDTEARTAFLTHIASTTPELREGKFYPDQYVVGKDATPAMVAELVFDRFTDEVVEHYTRDIEKIVPLTTTLTLASLLEREAYDFEDMRQIAGVIWNRLFIDMNLQIDATLQYAKGSAPSEPWWPQVRPKDKFIDSPYNTYQNEGLPPAPIANPSVAAIIAALNPRMTDCMFYFHDSDGGFHCTPTYEEHVTLLKAYYGKGK